jgi:hypothetical protein
VDPEEILSHIVHRSKAKRQGWGQTLQ